MRTSHSFRIFLLIIAFVPIYYTGYGQPISSFEIYHPPYITPQFPTIIQGKWFRNSSNSDSIIITCYIKKYLNTSGENVADSIYRKSMSAWNGVFQQAKIKIRFDMRPLLTTNPDSVLGDLNNSKINILGIANNIIASNALTTYGTTRHKQDTIEVDGQKFRRNLVTHIELNETIYKATRLINGKTERSDPDIRKHKLNAYLVATHELGHLLGMDHNVAPSSIMQPGYRRWIQILEDYDGTGDVPLLPIDEKYMRAIYAQFFLTDTQKSETCLPRSTR